MTITKEVANHILGIITNHYFLGSANIRSISQSKNQYDDRVSVNKSLFFRAERQRTVDALIDNSLRDLAHERIFEFRMELKKDQNSAEYKSLTLDDKRKYFHSNEIKYSSIAMAGNCGAMCSFGVKYLSENSHIIDFQRVEKMDFFKTLDHSFIVIGRNPSTPIEDYKSWNRDVMILDPWLNLAMTLDEFEHFWKKNFSIISSKSLADFYERDRTSGKIGPATLDFKLAKQFDTDLFSAEVEDGTPVSNISVAFF